MKVTLSILVSFFGLNSAIMAQYNFEIPIKVASYTQPDMPIERIEVQAIPADSSSLREQTPGRTGRDGTAIIRFKSSSQSVKVFYLVSEGPDGNEWYIIPKSPKPFRKSLEEADDRSESSMQVESFLAFPADESAIVAMMELEKGNTKMIASALAEAILIPSDSSGAITLRDPSRSYEIVAKTFHTESEMAKEMIQRWQSYIDSTTDEVKPDEKSLSALLRADIGRAAELAKVANQLSVSGKADQLAVSDTGRLVETIYQLNVSAQNNLRESRAADLETQLIAINNEIEPIRPTHDGASEVISFDSSNLDSFSEAVREAAEAMSE